MTTFKNSIKNNFLQHYDSSKFIKPLNKINHIKLSAIMHETSPTNNLCNKIYPRQVERILHKGPHSHSNHPCHLGTYIKKIKYSGNENNCWTNDRPREIESASRGRYNKQMIKEIHSEIQHKSRQSKSFAIRSTIFLIQRRILLIILINDLILLKNVSYLCKIKLTNLRERLQVQMNSIANIKALSSIEL